MRDGAVVRAAAVNGASMARCVTEADGWRRFWVSLGAGSGKNAQ